MRYLPPPRSLMTLLTHDTHDNIACLCKIYNIFSNSDLLLRDGLW